MKRIIFFDGVCNLCNGWVDWVLSRDTQHLFVFSSLQSDTAKSMLRDADLSLASIVLYDEGKTYYKSTAVLRIFHQLGGLWTLFSILGSILPVSVRDRIYDIVAKNRYKWFGKRSTCRLPNEIEKNFFV